MRLGRIVSIMTCMPELLRELCLPTVTGGFLAKTVVAGGPGCQGGGPRVHCSVPDRGVVRSQPRPPEYALQSRPHHQRSPAGVQLLCELQIDSSDDKDMAHVQHFSMAYARMNSSSAIIWTDEMKDVCHLPAHGLNSLPLQHAKSRSVLRLEALQRCRVCCRWRCQRRAACVPS